MTIWCNQKITKTVSSSLRVTAVTQVPNEVITIGMEYKGSYYYRHGI